MLALRWFLDNTRVRQLATDNAISTSTAYAYLHEAIDVPAACAPCVHDALLAAKAAGATPLNLDGTLTHTDRVATRGPNGADPWWGGKHKPALELYEAEHQMPTLTDLGYIGLSPAIRHPHKKPKGAELTETQTTYNTVIRAVHAVAKRANALLEETFAALQHVSLSPTRISAITKATLVLLHLEHGHPIPGGYTT